MDRATELEPPRLLCGEPNDGVLLGIVSSFTTFTVIGTPGKSSTPVALNAESLIVTSTVCSVCPADGASIAVRKNPVSRHCPRRLDQVCSVMRFYPFLVHGLLMKRDAEESPRFFLGEGIDLVTVFHAVCYQQGRCLSNEHVWAFFRWLLGAEEAEFHTARSLLWQKGAGLQEG